MKVYTVERINRDESKTLLLATVSAEEANKVAVRDASGFPDSAAVVTVWKDGKVIRMITCVNDAETLEKISVMPPSGMLQLFEKEEQLLAVRIG